MVRGLINIGQWLTVILFGLLCFFGLIHDWRSPLNYAVWAAGAGVVTAFLMDIALALRFRTKVRPFSQVVGLMYAGAILGFSLVFVLCGGVIGFYEIFKLITSPSLSNTISLILVATITLGGGLALFTARLKWRCLYGVSEGFIGIVVATHRYYNDTLATSPVPVSAIALAILTAGIYLVVRGIDNIHQGLTKAPLDPYGQAFLRRLNAWARRHEVLAKRNKRLARRRKRAELQFALSQIAARKQKL